MRTRQEAPDETTRLAVEMYARDQEALHQRLATEAALEEASVPAEYLRKAEKEVRRRRAEQTRRRQKIAIFAACLVPPALAAAYLIMRPPSAPIQESFAAAPESRWTLDVNPGSQASVKFDAGKATISVEKFGLNPTSPQAGYWATLRTFDGGKDLRTLKTLSFRVRGNGLRQVRFRFVRGSRSWVTPNFAVGSDWKTYQVSLDRLNQFRRKGDKETSDGAFDDRPRSSVSEIQIQTGNHVNPIDAKGTVEVDDVSIK